MSRVPKKPDFVTICIYAVLAVFVIYFSAALGACFDLSLDEDGKADFDLLASSLESTLMNTDLVFEKIGEGGKAMQFPIFTAFGIGLYVLTKITGKKKFHRKGEEHGSARWANKKEINSLLDKPPKQKRKLADLFKRKPKPKKPPKPKKGEFVLDNNIILTNDVKMSLNTRLTRKNLNVMVIGGSGSGKSRFYVKPNLMQANTSYVCTDPKGELLRSTGKMLESYGYKIKVFNLIDMAHSHNYNPFNYIYDVDGNYSTTAVIKMVNVLMKNTQKEGGDGGDQFWTDSTKALLSALCFYLVECEDKSMQNFSEVMKLLKKAEVKEGKDEFQSDLDLIFDALEHPEKYKSDEAQKDEKFKNLNLIDLAKNAKSPSQYMCLKYYKDFKKAAGDTAKSILISTAVRLQAFNIPDVMDLTCCDNIHLEMLGDEKTVMYIIIPSSDDTFNFLAAMMYTQLFDVLYDRANFKHGGRLPIHVRCLLDEFANVGTIPRFEELLATMRSMEISANVIIQNLSQLKKMYKDSWENVLGNCDSLLFLGGQEPTTLEHVSKTLGKETIDTRSRNRTRGRQGLTSENDGILGRELMTVDELKIMKDNECILFVRGIYPFFCNKFVIEKHPNYKRLEDFDSQNAYLIKDIETVKFNDESEAESGEDIHSEPVEDEKNSSEDVPKDEIEQSVTIEEILGGRVHTAAPVQFPKDPKNGSVAASLDDTDTVVTAEPHLRPPYTEVAEESYLDDLDSI
ncbi:MAG: type IV secretory system conjugative DNA transfer family protein [Lachnospiraceae bacterium]|nr:type IV secretory system conjugative DNA transfer family protein [Ruminococcus sp.]MCM1277133.1 type IV secretory system conjugative DNA transfer family protein [Lachnospiraceae bacterium]